MIIQFQEVLDVDTFTLPTADNYRKPQEPRVFDEADVRQLQYVQRD